MILRLIRKINTARYIRKYLTPGRNTVPTRKILRKIQARVLVNLETIFEEIRGMRYSDFLKTVYWQAISAAVRSSARGKCYLCHMRSNRLETHHIHYHFHGMEHLKFRDRTFLIPICRPCHQKQGARREREA